MKLLTLHTTKHDLSAITLGSLSVMLRAQRIGKCDHCISRRRLLSQQAAYVLEIPPRIRIRSLSPSMDQHITQKD